MVHAYANTLSNTWVYQASKYKFGRLVVDECVPNLMRIVWKLDFYHLLA